MALSRDIAGHDVRTAQTMGWAAVTNGELLALASQHFDVLVTLDRNVPFQQNLGTLPVAVVILEAKTSRLADLEPLVPDLLAALGSMRPGQLTRIRP